MRLPLSRPDSDSIRFVVNRASRFGSVDSLRASLIDIMIDDDKPVSVRLILTEEEAPTKQER